MKVIGIIAEDVSDVDVVVTLAKKITKKPFRVQRIVGHGCGRIVGKCHSWAKDLQNRGCTVLLLVHDLDDKSLPDLQQSLGNAIKGSPIKTKLVVIPVREVEAWLLADHDAINSALKLKKKISKVSNPEGIVDPKRRLTQLVLKGSEMKTIYLNTVHNKKIAETCSISRLRTCASFRPLENFLIQNKL